MWHGKWDILLSNPRQYFLILNALPLPDECVIWWRWFDGQTAWHHESKATWRACLCANTCAHLRLSRLLFALQTFALMKGMYSHVFNWLPFYTANLSFFVWINACHFPFIDIRHLLNLSYFPHIRTCIVCISHEIIFRFSLDCFLKWIIFLFESRWWTPVLKWIRFRNAR